MTNKITTIIKKSLPAGRQGFTLVETLGAVLLLSLALVGPMTIAQKGLQTALIAKDQNAAFNLAQDAVETIRFSRDSNCLFVGATSCPAGSWLQGARVDLTPCISTNGSQTCYFDSLGHVPTIPTQCPSNVCAIMYYDTANNYFDYDTNATPSIFTRTVSIKYDPSCTTTCNPAEADVTVTVSWNDPLPHSIVVNESLYNWQ